MKTEILKADRNFTENEKFLHAADIIKNGGLVAFPTETVYGLGADATNASACLEIFKAKGRPADNPLIVHLADPADAEEYAYTNPLYYELAEAFMPGPLTIILKKRDIIGDAVTAGLDSVALRCPSNPIAHALIEVSGRPIAAPSANRSGKPSPTRAAHVIEDMDGVIPMIIDGGDCDFGLESTVVSIREDEIHLLRPGAVTPEQLAEYGKVIIANAVLDKVENGEKVLSPGMKHKHYAPKAPLYLVECSAEKALPFFLEEQGKGQNFVLAYEEELPWLIPEKTLCIGKKEDVEAQSHALFDLLREADKRGAQSIYAHLPEKKGISLALYNRMIRAADYKIYHI